MKTRRSGLVLAIALSLAVSTAGAAREVSLSAQQAATTLRTPDVVYVPTPQDVVDAMLALASVTAKDIVYDLGSGDGRIPITAAQKHGARAVGIDINPERIKEANENLAKAGVGDRVRFINADLFESNLTDATVITLYLLPELNLKLLPKLLQEVKPGTRIVSHAFDMGTWKPEQALNVGGRNVYFWTIPAPGTPSHEAAMAAAKRT